MGYVPPVKEIKVREKISKIRQSSVDETLGNLAHDPHGRLTPWFCLILMFDIKLLGVSVGELVSRFEPMGVRAVTAVVKVSPISSCISRSMCG